MQGVEIHSTAIVATGVEIGEGSSVGPYSIIGDRVKIGKGNKIGPHVVLEGNTTLGDNNTIYQFASIGANPQDLKFKGEPSTLTIGSQNIIREFVTIQPGTLNGGMKTVVGDRNLFMANSHVGHDCLIGSGNIFANCASLAGHVTVEDYVTVGGLCGIHQFARLGELSFIGAGSMVSKDVPPFCMTQGDRAGLVGLNRIGLSRRGVVAEEIAKLKGLYREIFMGEGNFRERLDRAFKAQSMSKHEKQFLDFLRDSSRGVTLPRGEQDEDAGV